MLLIELYIFTLFLSVVIHQKWNLPYRYKKLIEIPLTEEVKLIDCFPCFSFWLSMIFSSLATFDVVSTLLVSCSVFITSFIINKL